MLVSVDVYRPAARQQLSILAQEVSTADLRGHARRNEAARTGAVGPPRSDADGPGRPAGRYGRPPAYRRRADAGAEQLKEALNPTEILFVADAMTGQDAVKSADEFHQRLGITGVILTKMDGDARGGAALSIRIVTGQPLKFVGVGEKTDALEAFHPDRVASRILGMGDVLSLIDKVRKRSIRNRRRRCRKADRATILRWKISAIRSSRFASWGRSEGCSK